MARNTTFALSVAQTTRANVARREVASLGAHNALTVNYIKRGGSDATLSGRVIGIVGKDSTEAVKIDTDKGPRSANLWAVKSVSVYKG